MHRGDETMPTLLSLLRIALVLGFASTVGLTAARGQTSADAGGYSDSTDSTRARTTRSGTDPARILRAARTIYIPPNEHIDAQYLEYKLRKLPEFEQWNLVIVKDGARADLVLNVHKKRMNYIFSVDDPVSSSVVANGKVVAINAGVAADRMAKEVVKRMSAVRALPTPTP
jgi:hypothetical protein